MANVLTLFLDAMYAPEPDDNDSLSHHGVPGMKWGKWNDETRRKYTGGTGRQRRGVDSMSLTPAQKRREARRQQRSAGLRKNIEKQGIIAGARDTKLLGKHAGESKTVLRNERVRNLEAKKAIESDTKRREANLRGDSDAIAKSMTDNAPKKLSEMSDMELNNAINRLRNEKIYKELIAERNGNKSEKNNTPNQNGNQNNQNSQQKKKKEPGMLETAVRKSAATALETGLTKGGKMLAEYAIDQSLGKTLDAKKAAQSKAAFDKLLSGIDTSMASSSKFKNQAENLSRSIELEKKYPGLISYLGGGKK